MVHRRRRTQRRVRHNIWIGLASLAIGVVAWIAFDPTRMREGISAATAYAGLVLLAVSLALGPMNLLRRRGNPVSTDLRRDVGLWAGAISLLHVVAGIGVHLGGDMRRYFMPSPAAQSGFPFRLDAFGFANYLGTVGSVLLLVLLCISSDRALGRLGAVRWKRLQRLNYTAVAAVVLHGALYQLIERRTVLLVVGFTVTIAAAVSLQAVGRRAYMSKRTRV